MNKYRRGIYKIGKILFVICVLFFGLSVTSSAAYDFDKALSEFPESYRPYLEKLHEDHPEWVFEPFETGLDWKESVDAQYGNSSLVQHSASSDILKSHDADDYLPDSDTYLYKDGGFVQASRLAVEYFLDPRNFLNENGIFQFERLSFSEIFTVDAVDLVLKNSFMHKAKISYLDSAGNTVKTEKTYAEVIYQAGKTYNINPCYLASKILNEVGSDGSFSVSGNHPSYPGIYNFYNIGATDGVNAITRGLAWANGGTDGSQKTYSRPWNTPEKSIMGGAEFLASSYIAVGQFTGYLQRFNVNPDSYHKVHTHQYMTNLTGALSQGYTSYASYSGMGLLDNQFLFSIPVYENMPEADTDGVLYTVDSKLQYGVINTNGINVRKGPSTSYARLQTSGGSNVLLTAGTELKIVSKHFTDATYYGNILAYPVWYKVKFDYNSASYTGYVLADYVDTETVTKVGMGLYDLGIFTDDDSRCYVMSDNPAICKVIDNDTVEFLSAGEVCVTVYNSRGLYDRIKYIVTDDISSYTVSDVTVSSDETSITVTLNKNADVERYGFYLKDKNGTFIKGGDITGNKYTFKNLENNNNYTVYVRNVKKYCYDNGPVKAVEASTKKSSVPSAPSDITVTDVNTNGYVLSWNCEDVDGFRVYRYRPELSKYVIFGDFRENSITVNDLDAGYACAYRIKSYRTVDSKRVYSDYSPLTWTLTLPEPPAGLSVDGVTDTGFTVSWNKADSADSYKLYVADSKGVELIYGGSDLSYTFNKAAPCTEYSVYAVSVASERGLTSESLSSDIVSVTTDVGAPENVGVSDITADSYKIYWDAIDNAMFYTIYRLDGSEKSEVVSTVVPYFEFTSLPASTKTVYCLTATYKVGNIMKESPFTDKFSVATTPGKVTNLKGEASDDEIVLTWDKVNNADCYNVYLRENGKYVLKDTVKGNTYTLTDLKDATKQYVRVRAYIRTTFGTQKGSLVTYSIYTKPETVTGITASSISDTSVTLKWNSSSDSVNRYYLYRSVNSDSGFKRVKALTKASVKLTGLSSGETFYFKVVPAIVKDGAVFLQGNESEPFTVKLKPSAPVNLKAEDIGKNSFTLSWDEVPNATNYRVYRYDTSTKRYILVKSVKGTELDITSLSNGKKYYYKVRSLKKEDGVLTYGYYSDIFTVTTKK
ncbi:MAG: fibronectin type III domain-containing protein [Clostridia bacterium]|nr:fibronectin type III domain-containing protein [Clostridia bacterium]